MKNARSFMLLHRAVSGYRRIATFFSGILGVTAAAALIALAVVFPLWLAATRQPRLYTLAVLCITALAVLFVIARSIRQQGVVWLVTVLRRVVTVAGTVMGAYLILVLLATGRLVAGIPLALVFILLLGIIAGWNQVGHPGERYSDKGTR